MSIFSHLAEILHVSFGVWILEKNPSYVPIGEIRYKHIHHFHLQTQRVQPETQTNCCTKGCSAGV